MIDGFRAGDRGYLSPNMTITGIITGGGDNRVGGRSVAALMDGVCLGQSGAITQYVSVWGRGLG